MKESTKQKLATVTADFFKSNFVIWAYLIVSVLIELTGVAVTARKFYIHNPLMYLSVIAIFTAVLFNITSQKGRFWCAFIILFAQFALDIIFIVVYDMTGSIFDFSMLNLRGDAMAILESIPIDFVFVFVSGLLLSLYLMVGSYLIKLVPPPSKLLHRAIVAVCLAAVLGLHVGAVFISNRNYNPADLTYKLYDGNDGSYNDRGILGNFVNEMYRGAFFGKVDLGDEDELRNYIYDSSKITQPTEMFGKANGYNVVTILCESFEWFGFMNDLADANLPYEAYPGGFKVSEETLRELYPNLYDFYDTSTVCVNHHSREKTDISENQSIIGNYPTNSFINYDFPQNTVPYSMPNIMKEFYGVDSYSFHNGEYTFYNRSVHHENVLGFVKYTASEQMAELHPDTFTDYNVKGSWYNLDSEMINACSKEMFPSDRRFNTYITTITMHGQYAYRKNLEQYYQKLFDYGIAQDYAADMEELETNEEVHPFVHYAAATMELDKAVGVMMNYLRNTAGENGKPLIDNTLIVMFGDHNAYYQSLTNDVKDLFLGATKPEQNYTDLFRVPLMIHIGSDSTKRVITKFTTTVDIVPTIMDLLGLKIFGNLYYGNSIYGNEESIIYSRAYDVFVTDKLFFSSLNNIKFQTADTTPEYINTIKSKAVTLLTKTSHVNRIFYTDYLSGNNATDFYNRMRQINGLN